MYHKKWLISSLIALVCILFYTVPALACGGPLSAGQSIKLKSASTLIAWHAGVEHYMTNFTYTGSAKNFGWVLPLPVEPEKIEKGDASVFSILYQETHKPESDWFRDLFGGNGTSAGAPPTGGAQVLQQTKIDALNITIIKGDGPQIVDWATGNGFTVDAHTRAHLLTYANASPIFMAAKYDIPSDQATKNSSQQGGQNTPVLLTMKTPHLWIPMELLAVDGSQTSADFYLLTDQALNLGSWQAKFGISPVNSDIPNAPGLQVNAQEQLSEHTTSYLASQTNMDWLWPNSWLTYLTLNASAEQVTYDIGISSSGIIHAATFGTKPTTIVSQVQDLPGWIPSLPIGSLPWIGFAVVFVLLDLLVLSWVLRRRRHKAREQAETLA